jgi:hypothetical protein
MLTNSSSLYTSSPRKQQQDCLVPSRYEANLKLGKWVETQRYEYTKLQRAGSAAAYASGAGGGGAIGAAGAILDPQSDNRSDENEGSDLNSNNSNMNITMDENNINKQPPVESVTTNNNGNAISNVNNNRPTNPRLTGDRLRRLESIGFEWKVKHKMKRYYDKQWDQMFARLMTFQESTGHCMVPKRYPPDMKL